MSDLIVSAFTPALGTGFGVRTYGIVRALCALGPVDLLYATFGAPEPGPEFEAIPSLTLHPVRPTRGPRRLASYARAVLAGMPAGFARGVSAELTAEAERLAAAPGRARVIADYVVPAGALLALARRRPVVYNAHNLESAFRDQIEGGRPMRTLERFEERVIEQASESWMVSSADVEGARTLVPGANIKYVPNVVDVAAIRPVKYPSGGRWALFVGNFEWAPNREAVQHLVDEVLPRLWEEMPEARLAIVGRGLDVPLSDDPRVEQFGFVPDLASVYARADCVVVPLLTSGGSPLKFVEALAYGVPVVATSTAARGLEVKGGEHYLEADDPPAFAGAVARSLRGEAAQIGARGRELAERAYSIESLVERVAP